MLGVSQLSPSYPALHAVHLQSAVVPPMVPPLMQKNVPSLPSLLEVEEAVQASAVWQLVPLYPALQVVHVQKPVVPPAVPPLMQ